MNTNAGYDPNKDEKGFNSYYDEFHFLLGKIVVNINLIEFGTMTLICNLIDTNNITSGFLSCKRKGATKLINSLKNLIETKIQDKDSLKEFDLLYLDLIKVIEHRNNFMHSLYLDSSNKEIKLTRETERVRRIGLREFEKGKTTIDSSIIFDLTSLRSLVQWLDHLNGELEKFTSLLRKEITINPISIGVPEEPDFLKTINKIDL